MSISMVRWAWGSALILVTTLAGCSGQQPTAGGFTPAGLGATRAVRSDRARSWMSPDAKKNDLLYVSDENTNDVYVYSYPGLRLEGTLTGFNAPFGECVDAHGNVFIADDDASQILEYAHGGTSPIATLNDPGFYPRGCSVDPTTGNLAVVNIVSTSLKQGNIAIYKGAKGTPKYYSDVKVYNVYSCGYDNLGNLFIDGENQASSSFAFAELPKAAKSIKNVRLNQSIAVAGGVQWDGKYVAVGDQGGDIYQFTVTGKKGTKTGTTILGGVGRNSEFWIQGSNIIVPDSYKRHVAIWDYPAGGPAERRVKGFSDPIGATVSVAK